MKFLLSEKAVSEVVGYAIILGITITGVALIALVGIPSIYQLQDMTTVKDVEQAFTFSDTKASGTLIGDAPMRVAQINLGGGTVTVEPNGTGTNGTGSGSYIMIKSMNNTFNITVPMGKVTYRYGDRIVGYEGGGIWSKYPSGGSVMLSPPEFHYDGRTLIFPIFTVNGNATIGGKGTATIVFKKNSTIVLFPNTTMGMTRTNPLNYSNTGQIYVNITSDFYDAWADYARSLSYTGVKTNSTSHTTSIVLTVVPSNLGSSTVITNPVSFKGLPPSDTTPLDNFSFKIYTSGMNKWDIRAKNGNRTLIFYLNQFNKLSVGYQDTDISSTGETWGPTVQYPTQHDNGGDYIFVDLLSNSTNLTYSDIISNSMGADNSVNCKKYGSRFDGTFTPDFSWDNVIINKTNANNTQSLYNITQHYFYKMAQIGDINFGECAPNDKFPANGSSMVLNYNATGAITFLHIANSTVDVSIS